LNVKASDPVVVTGTKRLKAAILPLSLTDFTATLKECQPQLNWTTASEINTDRFEIERSNANGNDWKFIAAVTASGYSSSKINYSYADKDFNISSEKVFYRLKMIDKDGTYKNSKIIPVLVNCKTPTILVYPNPVQDGKLYVSLTGTTGYVEATLLSASGQVVLKNKISNGTNYLNVLNIADGIYVLNVKDANGFDKNVKVSIKH
jgi:Secretion system C-terminal sorting domain